MIEESVEIEGAIYRIRAVTRGEFRAVLRQGGSEVAQEDALCRLAVVAWAESFPRTSEGVPDLDTCLAGIPTRLAVRILALSGFGESPQLEGYVREAIDWGTTPAGKRDILTMFVLPGVTWETLEDAPPDVLQRYYVAAQVAAQAFLNIPVPAFLDDGGAMIPEGAAPPGPAPPAGAKVIPAKSVKNPQRELARMAGGEGTFSFTSG